MRLKFFSLRGSKATAPYSGISIPDGVLEIVLWAIIAATVASTALRFAAAPAALAITGGLIAAAGAAAMAHAWREASARTQLLDALAEAQGKLIDLAEGQAQLAAKMAEIERRTIESPALIWRAATEDIEALSGFVSNLASAVAAHDQRLATAEAARAAPVPAASIEPWEATPVLSASPPDRWDSAAADASASDPLVPELSAPHLSSPAAPRPSRRAVPPAMVAELKSTFAAALASDRLELCLQPIAALPQRSVRGYEATLRVKGEQGEQHDGSDLRRIAAAAGLDGEFDRALVERAMQVLRILRARSREATAHCVVSGGSLASESFRSALDVLARGDSSLAAAVTLEIVEAEFEALGPAEREAMRSLAAKGFGFGLSNLRSLNSSLADAATLGVKRLRIDAETLLTARDLGGTDIHPADLPEFLRRRGIELLVAEVETERRVLDLLELSVPLAMGPLFGTARPVRPEILEPKAVPIAAARDDGAPGEPDAASSAARSRRQSFRSVLRRA